MGRSARASPCRRRTRSCSRLIVLTAIATWIIPAGALPARPRRITDPRHLPRGRVDPSADHRRLARGADQRHCTASRTRRPATSTCSTAATLFGAIDVAFFILVIGGFIGITMKTGAIQAGIARLVAPPARSRALDDPDPDDGLRRRRHHVRDGRGEPRLLRPDHHRDDRRRLRRARRRAGDPARLRHRCARLDRQPVRHRHRLGLRRRAAERRARAAPRDPDRRPGRRHLVRAAATPSGSAATRPRRSCTT